MNDRARLLLLVGLGVLVLTAAGGVAVVYYAQNAETQANEDTYRAAIAAAEKRWGLPPNLLHSLLYQESHFRTDIIDGDTLSVTGAAGIAQFEPDTAAAYGLNPLDPYQAIDGAAHYLHDLYARFHDWRAAVSAYNWGPGNVARRGLDAAPAGTVAYADQILTDAGIA